MAVHLVFDQRGGQRLPLLSLERLQHLFQAGAVHFAPLGHGLNNGQQGPAEVGEIVLYFEG